MWLKRTLIGISAVFLFIAVANAREWMNSLGTEKYEAEFVKLQGGNVDLRLQNGTITSVPLGRLCPRDQDFALQSAAAERDDKSTSSAANPSNAHEWTDSTGKHKSEGEFIELKDGMVRVRMPNGTIKAVRLEKLSQRDQEFARQSALGGNEKIAPQEKENTNWKVTRPSTNETATEALVSDYTTAIALNPKSAEAYYDRGIAYYKIGDSRKAIADLTKAIELNPKYADAYYMRGVEYGDLGQRANQLADYTKAIEFDPKDPQVFVHRGITYSELGQIERAISDYNRAIELDPNFANAYRNRAVDFAMLRKTDEARSDLRKAMALDPASIDRVKAISDHFKLGLAVETVPGVVSPRAVTKDGRATLPPFYTTLSGEHEVRVVNPNNFEVAVGIRSGRYSGIDFDVAANGRRSIFVPNGRYDIYFIYSDHLDKLKQGDSFSIDGNGIQITIVERTDGNYSIHDVN